MLLQERAIIEWINRNLFFSRTKQLWDNKTRFSRSGKLRTRKLCMNVKSWYRSAPHGKSVIKTNRLNLVCKTTYIKNPILKSSRRENFCKKSVPRKFAKFTGKHLCWSLFFINLLAWRLQCGCFPVNFAKVLGTLIL